MYLALSLKPYLLFLNQSKPLNQSHCLLYPLAGFIPVPLYLSATLSVYFSCSVFSGVDVPLLFPARDLCASIDSALSFSFFISSLAFSIFSLSSLASSTMVFSFSGFFSFS